MSTPNVSFQVENEAGVVFTVNVPYGTGAGTGSPNNPMKHAENVLRTLVKHGYMPVTRKPVNETVRRNLNHPNGKPQTPPSPRPRPKAAQANGETTSNGKDDEYRECPVHHVPMKRRENNGGVWYSHKVEQDKRKSFWCKGKALKEGQKIRKSG